MNKVKVDKIFSVMSLANLPGRFVLALYSFGLKNKTTDKFEYGWA
jgi:hypothetical protein